jgi:predicted GNAT superfamily acetyltransferase
VRRELTALFAVGYEIRDYDRQRHAYVLYRK